MHEAHVVAVVYEEVVATSVVRVVEHYFVTTAAAINIGIDLFTVITSRASQRMLFTATTVDIDHFVAIAATAAICQGFRLAVEAGNHSRAL